MRSFLRSLRGPLLAVLLPFATAPAAAEDPASSKAPTDVEVGQLERRMDALNAQIDHLEAATNDAVRQTLMRQHWLAMQDYLGEIHRRFGAGSPWMLDPGSAGGPGATACPVLGGSGAAWPLPEGIRPKQYGEQMRPHLQALEAQIGGIAKTADPAERRRLLEAHWQAMYRDLQGMRGLGWMWRAGMMGGGPGPAAGGVQPLPDPDSAGAKLVSRYCAQCHPAPAPTLKTAAEWGRATHRMEMRIEGRVAPIETPSDAELKEIVAYLKAHAR